MKYLTALIALIVTTPFFIRSQTVSFDNHHPPDLFRRKSRNNGSRQRIMVGCYRLEKQLNVGLGICKPYGNAGVGRLDNLLGKDCIARRRNAIKGFIPQTR